MVARGDALRELAQVVARQHRAQFRLPQQDDLQQLLRGGLEVGEQAHLLQRIERQVLRLVDDQHHAQPLRVGLEQVGVEYVDQRLDAAPAAFDGQPQFLADRFKQLDRRYARVQHQRHARVLRQLLQQQAAQRGLAGADLAGQLHEAAAAALADAETQVRERIAVTLAEEHEARIRGDRERWLGQAEVIEVHRVTGGASGRLACHVHGLSLRWRYRCEAAPLRSAVRLTVSMQVKPWWGWRRIAVRVLGRGR